MRKFNIFMVLFMSFCLTACAGRIGNPVPMIQPGDNSKSCSSLEYEVMEINQQMSLLAPYRDKTTRNVVFGVLGLTFPILWFFLDLKQGEQVEYNAYQQRLLQLSNLLNKKGCK
ncbi:hypothetical protein [Bartonella sp. DGB1]|uniref:hypothetical protein n=1 Tax=Bartonella sp. DGB1 TaxID=3239807 RepID=UPI003526A801